VFNVFSASTLESYTIVKLDPYEFNNSNTFNPDTYNEPFIFVILFSVVNPLTFNDDSNVVLLFNVVNPLTFNDDNNETILFKVVKPLTLNI
jgi:hypothetical protein